MEPVTVKSLKSGVGTLWPAACFYTQAKNGFYIF